MVEGQASGAGGLVDSHCHLFLLEEEPVRVVEASRAAGVEALVCVGIDEESSRRSREIADSVAGVFATAGVHPHHASSFDVAAGAAVEELIADPRVVGVGETGLDYYRMRSPAEDQRRVLRTHCALARESGKALVVHTREAWDDVARILEEEDAHRVVLHCFSGDARAAERAADNGWYCSFAGNVTYPGNGHLLEAAGALPLDLVLVETDSPFLAPQSRRGKDNHPSSVALVAEAVAAARGEDPDRVSRATGENARRAFSLPGRTGVRG